MFGDLENSGLLPVQAVFEAAQTFLLRQKWSKFIKNRAKRCVMVTRPMLYCQLYCHVTSCHVMSRHATSCYIIPHHVTSCHVMSRHATSCNILSRHVTSCHVMLRHVTSCHAMPRHATSCNVTSCHHIMYFMLRDVM